MRKNDDNGNGMRKMRMRKKEWKRDIIKRLDNFLVPKCPIAWRARMAEWAWLMHFHSSIANLLPKQTRGIHGR